MSSEQPNNANNGVSLGCGTLILIAVIVSIFSGGNDDVERDVRQMRNDVREVRDELKTLRGQMEELRVLLETRVPIQAEAQ